MYKNGIYSTKPYYKVATIVGLVLAYHAHGDASVNDALVRLAQDFNLNMPLIDGHGNFGFLSGDSAAAARYIEARLSKYGELFLKDLNESSVNWRDNYDGRLKEPATLTAPIPNLLVNGAVGIAQAYATSIPPHNLGEVIDMTIKIIENPDITVEEVAKNTFPDFPTGGVICNAAELTNAYINKDPLKAYSVKIRGIIDIDKNNNLIIKEIPFMKNTAMILDSIQEKVNEKKIEGIADIIDETNKKNGIKINIKIKRGFDAESIRNQIFIETPMESSFGINLVATKDYEFGNYNILELYQEFIEYRRTTIRRLYNSKYSNLCKSIHITEGLIKALKYIDEIIAIIKSSNDKKEVINNLVSEKKFNLTHLQAENIAEMKLYTLSKMNRDELKEKRLSLLKDRKEIEKILSSSKNIDKVIIDELREIKNKFSKPRKTKIDNIKSFSVEDTIPDENFKIFLTKDGYVKKILLDVAVQKRGGVGRSSRTKNNDDIVVQIIDANSKDNVLFFTNKGRVFSLKAYEITPSKLNSVGTKINSYFKLIENENVIRALALNNETLQDDEKYLTFVTRKGLVKRSSINLYKNVSSNGLIATRLNDDDSLINIKLTTEDDSLVIATKNGLGIRFNVEQIPMVFRTTLGCKGITLNETKKDEVVSFDIVSEDMKEIVIINSNGLGKKIDVSEVPVQNRGGKGRIISKLRDNSYVVSAHLINGNNNENIIVQTKKNIIKFSSNDLAKLGRITYGNRIVKLSDGDIITSSNIETE